MKKVLLSSVLLGSLLVGCSQQNNQFSVTCQDVNEECHIWYHNRGKVVEYYLDYNETLYFNYPDEGRIRIENAYHDTKIFSTEEIITDNNDIVKINENEIILLD